MEDSYKPPAMKEGYTNTTTPRDFGGRGQGYEEPRGRGGSGGGRRAYNQQHENSSKRWGGGGRGGGGGGFRRNQYNNNSNSNNRRRNQNYHGSYSFEDNPYQQQQGGESFNEFSQFHQNNNHNNHNNNNNKKQGNQRGGGRGFSRKSRNNNNNNNSGRGNRRQNSGPNANTPIMTIIAQRVDLLDGWSATATPLTLEALAAVEDDATTTYNHGEGAITPPRAVSPMRHGHHQPPQGGHLSPKRHQYQHHKVKHPQHPSKKQVGKEMVTVVPMQPSHYVHSFEFLSPLQIQQQQQQQLQQQQLQQQQLQQQQQEQEQEQQAAETVTPEKPILLPPPPGINLAPNDLAPPDSFQPLPTSLTIPSPSPPQPQPQPPQNDTRVLTFAPNLPPPTTTPPPASMTPNPSEIHRANSTGTALSYMTANSSVSGGGSSSLLGSFYSNSNSNSGMENVIGNDGTHLEQKESEQPPAETNSNSNNNGMDAFFDAFGGPESEAAATLEQEQQQEQQQKKKKKRAQKKAGKKGLSVGVVHVTSSSINCKRCSAMEDLSHDMAKPNPYPPTLVHDKYWAQRRRLFSRFDEGIELDAEGWYSVTPEAIADHVARRVGDMASCMVEDGVNGVDGIVILDAFCGCGGNAIAFGKLSPFYVSQIICVDLDRSKLRKAAHNAALYNIDKDKIVFVHANSLFLLNQGYEDGQLKLGSGGEDGLLLPEEERVGREEVDGFVIGGVELLPPQVHMVFMDPPWGGVEYGAMGKEGYDLVKHMKIHCNVPLSLPSSSMPTVNGASLEDTKETATTIATATATGAAVAEDSDQGKNKGCIVDGVDLLRLAASATATKVVVYDIPRNTSKASLGYAAVSAGYRGNFKLEEYYLNGRLKTATAFVGQDYTHVLGGGGGGGRR